MLVKCRCGKIWSKQPYKLANVVMGICEPCRGKYQRAQQVVHVVETRTIQIGRLTFKKA